MAEQRPTKERPYLLRRTAALFYDLLLNAALWMIAGSVILAIRGGTPVPAGSLWFRSMLFAVTAVFFIGFWTRGGQTAGMKAWRIRVVTRDGGALTGKAAACRFLGACLSMACAGLGFLWAMVDADGLTWHDRMAGTRVRLVPRNSRRTVDNGIDGT